MELHDNSELLAFWVEDSILQRISRIIWGDFSKNENNFLQRILSVIWGDFSKNENNFLQRILSIIWGDARKNEYDILQRIARIIGITGDFNRVALLHNLLTYLYQNKITNSTKLSAIFAKLECTKQEAQEFIALIYEHVPAQLVANILTKHGFTINEMLDLERTNPKGIYTSLISRLFFQQGGPLQLSADQMFTAMSQRFQNYIY